MIVVALTASMMAGEIVAGTLFGSMALLADGWHMATHAAAIGIAGLAYLFARRYAQNARFAFGAGKFGDLAAFSSAIMLAMIAVQIAYESVVRMFNPVTISCSEAIVVAVLGLTVNIASAWLLQDSDHHHHHGGDHSHHHHDNNIRAAYGLIRDSGAVLLDASADKNLETTIGERIETKGDRVTDLHLWQVGPGHRAAIISVISDNPLPPKTYKRRLGGLRGLSHLTIEVEACPHHAHG